jgi:hypothetical protein
MKLGEVLSHTDFGDAEGAREDARAQRTPRFEHVEHPAAVVRAHACLTSRPIKKQIAFSMGES